HQPFFVYVHLLILVRNAAVRGVRPPGWRPRLEVEPPTRSTLTSSLRRGGPEDAERRPVGRVVPRDCPTAPRPAAAPPDAGDASLHDDAGAAHRAEDLQRSLVRLPASAGHQGARALLY